MCGLGSALLAGDVLLSLSDSFFNAADQALNLAGILLRCAGNFQVGVVRGFPNRLFDLPFYFVKLAFSLVLRTWFHLSFSR